MQPFPKAFILAGGAAVRAGGANKSLFRIDGRAIVEHQLERLRPLFGADIAVVTDRPGDYGAFGLRCIPDLPPRAILDLARSAGAHLTDESLSLAGERSPLRGFATALAAEPERFAFLLAGDMPWPDPALIRAQWDWLRTHESGLSPATDERAAPPPAGICLRHNSRLQPFHGIYCGSLAGSLAAASLGSDRSLRGWTERNPAIAVLEASELNRPENFDLDRYFRNFNEPPAG